MNNIISLENGSGAFLKNNGKYLLMKRSAEKKISPNVWSCVGGHMEQNEINNPLDACLREIWEETGIKKENIVNMELRYIIIRRLKNIIRQNYIYFGETNTNKFIDTDEGKLYWIKEEDLLDREYTQTYAAMMEHYIKNKEKQEKIIVGIAGNINGKLKMKWSMVEDFE
jgi:8-oxo-dGTP diphosphatase